MSLRVALVGGPMYDGLYRRLPVDVEVVVHADHPTLNREVARRLAEGERLDLVSTHGKYAPSQRRWLRPLDGLVDAAVVDELAPRALELCRFEGELLCLPRNIDVRVLWWRTDRMEEPPRTWDAVAERGGFGFTGRESGLFGLFYELVVDAGGTLFDPDGNPVAGSGESFWVEGRSGVSRAGAPPEVIDWHYDDVDAALAFGRVDMAATWPGGYGRLTSSAAYPLLAPARYPGAGSYAGCHAWAVPTTCGDVDGAVELLRWLASLEAGAIDASGGAVPANNAAMTSVEPRDDTDARRLAITRDAIADSMLTYPPLEEFPAMEEAGWRALRDAIAGRDDVETTTMTMQNRAESVLGARR